VRDLNVHGTILVAQRTGVDSGILDDDVAVRQIQDEVRTADYLVKPAAAVRVRWTIIPTRAFG